MMSGLRKIIYKQSFWDATRLRSVYTMRRMLTQDIHGYTCRDRLEFVYIIAALQSKAEAMHICSCIWKEKSQLKKIKSLKLLRNVK